MRLPDEMLRTITQTLLALLAFTACTEAPGEFRSADIECTVDAGGLQVSRLGFNLPGCSSVTITSEAVVLMSTDGAGVSVGGITFLPDASGLIALDMLDYNDLLVIPMADGGPILCDPSIICCSGRIKIPPPMASKSDDSVSAGNESHAGDDT